MPFRQGEALFHKPGESHSIASDPNAPPTVFIITFYCPSKDMSFFNNRHMNVPTPLRKYITEMISDGQEAYHLVDDSPYESELKKRVDGYFGEAYLVSLVIFNARAVCKIVDRLGGSKYLEAVDIAV